MSRNNVAVLIISILGALSLLALLTFGIPRVVQNANQAKFDRQIACIDSGGTWMIATDDCVTELNQKLSR